MIENQKLFTSVFGIRESWARIPFARSSARLVKGSRAREMEFWMCHILWANSIFGLKYTETFRPIEYLSNLDPLSKKQTKTGFFMLTW